MENFKEVFCKFVEDTCCVDLEVRVQSSKLFNAFIEWLNDKCIKHTLNNKVFAKNIKLYFPEYKCKRCKSYNAFTGLCLKIDYISPCAILSYEEKKQKEKEYKREYYIKNRERINEHNKQYYKIISHREKELMRLTNITEQQLYKRKKLRLIEYILDREGNVNWEQTIERMNIKVEQYVFEQTKEQRNQIKEINKVIDCHNYNLQHYEKLGDIESSTNTVQLINSCEKQTKQLSDSISKKESIKITTSELSSDLMKEGVSKIVITKPKLKIVNKKVDTDYDIDINSLTKEKYIEFRKWHNKKSDEIWNLEASTKEKDSILQEFYNRYYYVDDKFEELYGEEDYNYT